MTGQHPCPWIRDIHEDPNDLGPLGEESVLERQPVSPDAIREVRLFFLQRLPREIVDKILDHAQYWVSLIATMRNPVKMVSWRAHGDYIEKVLAETDPLPRIDPEIGSEEPRVRMVKFILDSHDQGWGGEPSAHGTYRHSHSWFQASIVRSQGSSGAKEVEVDGRKRFHVQNNVLVVDKHRAHTVIWTDEPPSDPSKVDDRLGEDGTGSGLGIGFARSIMPGDHVRLLGMAQYDGWANYVRYARIEVYYSV